MPFIGSSANGGDSDMFCISVTLHLFSADDTDMDESCSGKHAATYVTYDAKCRGNDVVDMSVLLQQKTQTGFVCFCVLLPGPLALHPLLSTAALNDMIEACMVRHGYEEVA